MVGVMIAPMELQQAPAAQAHLSYVHHNESVFVLLDDESLLVQFRAALEMRELEVQTFSSVGRLLVVEPPTGPACLLTAIRVGQYHGLEVYDRLKQAGWGVPAIFLVDDGDVRTAVCAMRAGAEDVIPKQFEMEEVVSAVLRALEKLRQARRGLSGVSELQRRAGWLTIREREIIRLVVSGLLNKQIAQHLGLALVTVKVHRGNAMRKLGSRSAAELVRIARAVGLTSTECEVPPLSAARPRRRRKRRSRAS
jgi:FixJ family two-component response regulator